MAHRTGALQAVLHHVDVLSATPHGRRAVRRWQFCERELAGYSDAAELARAVSRSGPADQDRLVGALLRVADRDHLAQLVVVAALEKHLRRVLIRWRAAGVPASQYPLLESDLISECWAAVGRAAAGIAAGSTASPKPALALIDAAWHSARAPRLRERRAPFRQVRLDEAAHLSAAVQEHRAVELTQLLLAAVQDDRLDRRSASVVYAARVLGSGADELARLLGVSPSAARKQLTRCERRLVTAVTAPAGPTAA